MFEQNLYLFQFLGDAEGERTWDVITLWLNPRWEISVFWNGVGVIVQRRQLGQDLSVPRH